jgi:hypothetical protein
MTSTLLTDGVHSDHLGTFVVVIDGRVVMDGPLVARFADRTDAERFFATAIR